MKDHLDWIEVRGILRQIAQACADCLDGVFDAKDFVGGKVVHHHNVSALERRGQTLLEVGQKDFAVHCSVDQHRRDYSGETQARNEGHGLPVPSGTYPIKRSPRGLRPFGRTMLVLTAVSSMNTNLAGSRSPCSRIQRRRARATSARCCSAARRLFFNGDVMTSEETPKRRTASTDSFLVHRRNDLIERQVRLLSNKGEDPFRVLLQRGDAPSPWLGPGRSVRFPALHPSNRRTRADLQLFGGLTPRRSRLHKSNDSHSHLTGIRSAHGPPPGESMRIESVPGRPLGIPDSPRPENPLGQPDYGTFGGSSCNNSGHSSST